MLQHVLSCCYSHHHYLLVLFSGTTNFSNFCSLLYISSLCCNGPFPSFSLASVFQSVLSCHYLYHQYLLLLFSDTANLSMFFFLLDILSLCCNDAFSSISLFFVVMCSIMQLLISPISHSSSSLAVPPISPSSLSCLTSCPCVAVTLFLLLLLFLCCNTFYRAITCTAIFSFFSIVILPFSLFCFVLNILSLICNFPFLPSSLVFML